jgi:hypothetical protein
MQKASGFMNGGLSSRYKSLGEARESDNIHSWNFIARRAVVEKRMERKGIGLEKIS